MGAGKRTGPVRRGLRKLRRQRSGLTDTEICAELVNKGMSLKEYAGLTDRQIFHLYFRPRDKYGRLKRRRKRTYGKLVKIHKPMRWDLMFKKVWLDRGLTPEQVEAKFKEHMRNNPDRREIW